MAGAFLLHCQSQQHCLIHFFHCLGFQSLQTGKLFAFKELSKLAYHLGDSPHLKVLNLVIFQVPFATLGDMQSVQIRACTSLGGGVSQFFPPTSKGTVKPQQNCQGKCKVTHLRGWEQLGSRQREQSKFLQRLAVLLNFLRFPSRVLEVLWSKVGGRGWPQGSGPCKLPQLNHWLWSLYLGL